MLETGASLSALKFHVSHSAIMFIELKIRNGYEAFETTDAYATLVEDFETSYLRKRPTVTKPVTKSPPPDSSTLGPL